MRLTGGGWHRLRKKELRSFTASPSLLSHWVCLCVWAERCEKKKRRKRRIEAKWKEKKGLNEGRYEK
jgi:hypothetical protein